MKKSTEEWIQKAEEDYLAVNKLKPEMKLLSVICFHAQQCVEKYMKAILQENNIEFEKIHDLNILLKDCVKFLPNLQEYRKELTMLSTYAVDIRYPGYEVSKDEAEECIKIMEKIRKIIREYFDLPEE